MTTADCPYQSNRHTNLFASAGLTSLWLDPKEALSFRRLRQVLVQGFEDALRIIHTDAASPFAAGPPG